MKEANVTEAMYTVTYILRMAVVAVSILDKKENEKNII